jgi:hypothetical protein
MSYALSLLCRTAFAVYRARQDPVAVAYVVRPELFECRRMRVDIETCSPLSYGQTVCDVWGQSGRPANVNVALRVDVAGFWELLLDAVGRADAVSPLNSTTTTTTTNKTTNTTGGVDEVEVLALALAAAAELQEQGRE